MDQFDKQWAEEASRVKAPFIIEALGYATVLFTVAVFAYHIFWV